MVSLNDWTNPVCVIQLVYRTFVKKYTANNNSNNLFLLKRKNERKNNEKIGLVRIPVQNNNKNLCVMALKVPIFCVRFYFIILCLGICELLLI